MWEMVIVVKGWNSLTTSVAESRMSYGARVRILGAAWNVVKVQGKRYSPVVVSKDSKGKGEVF